MQYLARLHLNLSTLTAIFAVFLCAFKASGQDTLQVKKSADSSFIERFDDFFIVKPSITTTAEALVAKTGNFNIVLQPNTSEILRTYFNYHFISFYVDYLPRFAGANKDDNEKGKTKLFGLGASTNMGQWFASAGLSKTQGYYVENTVDFRPDWRDGDAYLQVPDLYFTSYDLALGYNTNKKLSLLATSSQTERQLKSAGGFLPKISLRYYIIDDRTATATSNEKSNNVQALLGAGYQYTVVLKKTLYLVGAFTPSFGYIHTKVNNRGKQNSFSFTQRGPIYQWDGKLGLGYNSHTFFAGSSINAVSAKYSQGLTSAENQNTDLFFELFVGFRLKAPRFISKNYKKIFN